MKRKTEITVYIICTAVLIWVLASWIDVVAHNGNENPSYAVWNLWAWLAERR